jgi:hypothetical protein
MRKWLVLLVCVLLIGSIYFFIPSKLPVSKSVFSYCSVFSAKRYFSDTSKWIAWLPKNNLQFVHGENANTTFTYNGFMYEISKVLYSDVNIIISGQNNDSIESSIHIAPVNRDSSLITWKCFYPTTNNILKKFSAYQQAVKLKKNMDVILDSLHSFINDPKNIYGADFHETMSHDFTLATITSFTPSYPTTEKIYQLIDSLRQYVSGEGAKEVNYPMLNVEKKPDSLYRVMVAVSTNVVLPTKGNIINKRFIPWKMIEGDVHGGVHTINEGFIQLHNYTDDYHRNIMAIPFQFLITDRRKETDTLKWVTRIAAPVS